MTYSFTEKEVAVKGEYELSATLTIPEGKQEKYPAIVMISGTGGANRDGNMKGYNMNIYKQLAEYLASLGFITIRYDKRGIAKSKGDAYKTSMNDLVEDIISNVRYLKGLPNVDAERIILLGHSEGCILATIANKRYPVAGLILVAGAGTSLRTALQSQNYGIIEEVKVMKGIKGALLRRLLSEKQIISKQNRLFEKVLTSNEDVMKVQFSKIPAKWMREHLSYKDEDILNMLKEADCPVFAITGDKDVQAASSDLNKVEALNKDSISCLVLKDMDHVLREHTGPKSVMNVRKQYALELDKPIHSGLKEALKAWCETWILKMN